MGGGGKGRQEGKGANELTTARTCCVVIRISIPLLFLAVPQKLIPGAYNW